MEDITERAFVVFVDSASPIVTDLTLGDRATGLMWPWFAPGLVVEIGERLGWRDGAATMIIGGPVGSCLKWRSPGVGERE